MRLNWSAESPGVMLLQCQTAMSAAIAFQTTSATFGDGCGRVIALASAIDRERRLRRLLLLDDGWFVFRVHGF
jgi:hypothetical protein